jgi:hypothetical protein
MRGVAGNDIELGHVVGTEGSLPFPRTIRDKHLYVCGATGTGKSKFLEHLIRQDIRRWPKSKCGVLLLDPHGSLYDSIMRWLARAGVTHFPIIPIDLRQDDWIVSYNAIRKRGVTDCSVIVDAFVSAMAHVWGESGTDQTPRFARWVSNVLRTLYANDLTLLESEYLVDHLDKLARHTLMEKLDDRASRRDWQFANELNARDFENALGSTVNRLQRFLRNKRMRAVFGNSRVSLDLKRALDEGHIILVSLATAGAKVSAEDADLFATLLLSDLWTAALERGKKPGVKPFYVYLDEAQRFVTPTIASNLDEARGFGLHLTLANQFPQQFLDAGVHGERLYHSIMENASSKVCFRLQSEENLRPLAQWLFRGVMDPDEIKHSLSSTKVLSYEEVLRTSRTRGVAYTESLSESEGVALTDTATSSLTESSQAPVYDPANIVRGLSANASAGHSSGIQQSTARSESTTHSYSETESAMLLPIFGKEVASVQFRSLDEQLHYAMAKLFEQEQRRGFVRLAGMKAPVSIMTPSVADRPIVEERLKEYTSKLLAKWDFALPVAKAASELADREKRIEALLRYPNASEEPENYRRRVTP